MIRTFAVLAGGFLGFAAALMVANTPAPDAVGATAGGYADATSGIGKQYAEFETELGEQPTKVPFEVFSDDDLDSVDAEPTVAPVSMSSAAKKSGFAVDQTSDIYRVQVELVRLQCFEGDANGKWSLDFHEALSDLALTSELDLKRLGSISKVLVSLRGLEFGVCARDESFAEHTARLEPWVVADVPLPTLRKPLDNGAENSNLKRTDRALDVVDRFSSEHDASALAFERLESVTMAAEASSRFDPNASILRGTSRADLGQAADVVAKTNVKTTYIFPLPEGRHADVFLGETTSTQHSEVEQLPVFRTPEPGKRAHVDNLVTRGVVQETVAVDELPIVVAPVVPKPLRAKDNPQVKESRLALAANTDRVIGDVVAAPVHAVPIDDSINEVEPAVDPSNVIVDPAKSAGAAEVTATTLDMPLPVRKTVTLQGGGDASLAPSEVIRSRSVGSRPRHKGRSVRVRSRTRSRSAVIKRKSVPAVKPKKAKPEKSWKQNRTAIFSSRG